ncbi:MAG: sigma 54-interacting transcriptional regulator [Gammaproteobacteria bacterium]
MTESVNKVLVIDDDCTLLKLLAIRLTRAGFEVQTAEHAKTALGYLPVFKPNVVITDMCMPDIDGLALFEVIHSQQPGLPVIILTAHGTIPDAIDATRLGIFAYLTKPYNSDELTKTTWNAIKVSSQNLNNQETQNKHNWRAEIITHSSKMDAMLHDAHLLAKSESSILIQGDSGTGKELIAHAIHKASKRKDKPFIAVNCTAIPEALLESELFGHQKGSFTGANESHIGLLEAANNGTLMLDEIGDMPLPFQTKLLRVLQEREIRPVGSTQSRTINVRVISATHHDLEKSVANGSFREDLFYRLNVVTLKIPTLAERAEDIPLLAKHFLSTCVNDVKNNDIEVTGFAIDAMEVLVSALWPGNVRQLCNVVEQCVVLTTQPIIPSTLVKRALNQQHHKLLSFVESRDRFELDYLVNILQISGGNVAQAARLAKRNRTEFYKLLNKHHLEPKMFREQVALH